MKLSKTAWLTLIIGIFVIAIGSLYWLYMQEGREQKGLSEVLAKVQATLPTLAAERTNLEDTLTELKDRLAQATSQVKTAKAAFPDSVQTIEVDETLFGIADDWGLEVTLLTATEPRDRQTKVEVEDAEVEDIEVEDVTYQLSYFTVDVKGKAPESDFKTEEEYKAYIGKAVADILNFLNAIVNESNLDTATVELVNITIPEPLSETERLELSKDEIEDREGIEVPSATINLVIYTYKGE